MSLDALKEVRGVSRQRSKAGSYPILRPAYNPTLGQVFVPLVEGFHDRHTVPGWILVHKLVSDDLAWLNFCRDTYGVLTASGFFRLATVPGAGKVISKDEEDIGVCCNEFSRVSFDNYYAAIFVHRARSKILS